MTVRLPRRAALAAITSASLITAVPIGPAAADPLPLPSGGFTDGIYVPINDVDITGPGGASVLANGNVALSWAGSQLQATVEDDQLQSLQSELGLRGAITLDLSARTAGDIDDTLEVLAVPLASFSAGPATVTPFLGVNVRISGQAEAGAHVGIVAPFDVSTALSGAAGQVTATTTGRPGFEPEVGLPDASAASAFTVSVSVEVTMTFMLAINGIPVGGPVLLASLGTELTMDPTAWDLDTVTALRYGWSRPDLAGAPEPPRRTKRLVPERRRDLADGAISASPVSTRWSTTFGLDQYDGVGGLVPVGDELVLIEDGGFPWMASLDGDGTPSWQQIGTRLQGWGTVMDLARTADGGLVALGQGPRIERFAADGTPLWARQITIDGIQSGSWSSIVSVEGGMVVAGRVRYADGSVRPVLVDVDDAGNVVRTSELDLGALHTDFQITAAVTAPDGDLLVAGRAWYFPDGAHDQWDALVLRVAPDGTVDHAQTLGGPFSEDVTDIAVHDDGSYAIVGSTVRAPGEAPRALVAAFGADDQLRWSSAYLDRTDLSWSTTHSSATGITAVGGGDWVVSGRTGLAQDAWLMRLDGSGMPVWAKSLIGPEDDELTGVVAMEHGVAAFGRTESTDSAATGFDDIWVVRTNVDGMVHFDPASGFDAVNHAVEWTPMPGHGARTLEAVVTALTATAADTPFGAAPAAATETHLA